MKLSVGRTIAFVVELEEESGMWVNVAGDATSLGTLPPAVAAVNTILKSGSVAKTIGACGTSDDSVAKEYAKLLAATYPKRAFRVREIRIMVRTRVVPLNG